MTDYEKGYAQGEYILSANPVIAPEWYFYNAGRDAMNSKDSLAFFEGVVCAFEDYKKRFKEMKEKRSEED